MSTHQDTLTAARALCGDTIDALHCYIGTPPEYYTGVSERYVTFLTNRSVPALQRKLEIAGLRVGVSFEISYLFPSYTVENVWKNAENRMRSTRLVYGGKNKKKKNTFIPIVVVHYSSDHNDRAQTIAFVMFTRIEHRNVDP